MNIYIAKDYNSIVLGLIVAISKDIAWTYFETAYKDTIEVEEIKLEELEKLGRPYFKLVETECCTGYELNQGSGHNNKYRLTKNR